jgi:hypothetical protein
VVSHPPQPRFRGGRAVLFVGVTFALYGLLSLYLFVIGVSNWLERDYPTPLWLAGNLLRGFGLSILAPLMVRYSVAVRRYDQTGGGMLRVAAAHATMWRWAAGLLAAQLVQSAAMLAVGFR